jgi:cold shock CspA family protein
MKKGMITRILPERLFGFIATPEGTDFFFHLVNAEDGLKKGDRVLFELADFKGKTVAVDVKRAAQVRP